MVVPPFDQMFGAGAADKLRLALDLSTILPGSTFDVHEELVEGGVTIGVVVAYAVEEEEEAILLTIRVRQNCAIYDGLGVSAGLRGRGVYRQTVCAQSGMLAELGVPAMAADPADERAEYLLALGGFHWQTLGDERRFCTMTVGDRAEEYREWIAAGRPEEAEPIWHAELMAHPVPGELVF